ncbi:hypothetical protein Ddye_001613 [Dipteronia dyeriana]|uniref:SWIM-type domain-containing protein n=1 Tax=Dipteronia dyeriana TaxID=168575 RepID=A0AAE0CTP8_9ROSI|nr:hypothetical protein Ddye_001613 [Dipteronia dyeriana]
MPIEIVDDEDIQLLLSRENVDPLVCISVEEIGHQSPEMKHNPPESSHNLHHVTMDEFRRSDVPNMAAHLDDIREGLQSPPRHFSFQDTTGNQQIPKHDETEPQFNFSREGVPNQYDEQFANVQRLVPPQCAFYSINSSEVTPRPVNMRLEVGELFLSKRQLQSQIGCSSPIQHDIKFGALLRIAIGDCVQLRFTIQIISRLENLTISTRSTEARFSHQRQTSARVIGEHIQEKFRDHRLYKPKEIIHDMQREFGISCNCHKGYRARHISLEEVQGTPVESYSNLPSYLYMLEKANPETITDLHTDSSNRPIIAIDGTLLKCPHRGVLFVAVCMDGNDQIFPLAFGVSDSETNEACEWFLTRLHKAVGEVVDLVIVSDRKGSITTGVEKVFSNSFHGVCAVHLERNMVGHYGRIKALKQYFRRAVRVYRESQFIQHMEQLANINPEAAQYVTNIGIELWARAHNPRKRYNIMSTNIAEAMNNAIKECKELPITGVIDYIRGVLQHWFHDRRTTAHKLTTQLTTDIDVAIGVKDDKARYMRIYPITFYTFLVKDGGLDGHVDLTAKTCTCKEFDVDQIPCAHALAYSGEIHPVGQPSEWLVLEDIVSKIVHPPVGRRGPGRLKKNCIPSFGEDMTQRSCTTCHRVGHNSHTCTYPKASRPSSGMESISEIGEASRSHDVVE